MKEAKGLSLQLGDAGIFHDVVMLDDESAVIDAAKSGVINVKYGEF